MLAAYTGKKILFMGDSITALGGWVNRFCEIIQSSLRVIIAVSGARWQDDEQTVYDGKPSFTGNGINHNNRIGNQLEMILRRKDPQHCFYHYDPDYEDFDLIVISAGTNDVDVEGLCDDQDAVIASQFVSENGHPLPLDMVDRKTWPGIMRYVSEHLRRLYPAAEIIYCTPIQGAEEVRPYYSFEPNVIT